MRVTVTLPDSLMEEALRLTRLTSKTEVIRMAQERLILHKKSNAIKNWFGKADLDIDLDALRKR